MNFQQPNLKKLLTLSFYGSQIFDEALDALLESLNIQDDFSGEINPSVSDFLLHYSFTNGELESLTEISDWMASMFLIKRICPGFGGEEMPFPIRSFEDIPQFKHLEKFAWHDDFTIDTAPLLTCPTLKEIILLHSPRTTEGVKTLEAGGFKVVSVVDFGEIKLERIKS